jgi:subtilisin family serine protease
MNSFQRRFLTDDPMRCTWLSSRIGILRGWLLALTGAVMLGLMPALPSWPGLPRGTAAEEATPESVVPSSPASGRLERAHLLARLGVDRWHAAGYLGNGVKIAVLDSGFRGYRAFLGTALPRTVLTRSFRNDGDLEARASQHGILCGEVLHALAPAAELLFANWEPDSPQTFLDALQWAKDQGATIVTCSLIMPSWSDGEGGGAINQTIARIVGPGQAAGDLLCFASAGNTAQRHWSGPLRPAADGFHQWTAGECDNRLTPWSNERVSVELYGSAGGRYELSIHDAVTGALIGSSVVREGSEGGAVLRFQPQPRHSYQVRVRADKPAAAGSAFHLVVLGGYLAHTTAWGSISCPADGPGVLAVGAVDERGNRLFYSSCGPNSGRPKPDFVAEVPFPSLWRPQPFSGTSAAAPQAAGLAALWWSRHPNWRASQVSTAMRRTARDLGPPGHDWETGYGLVTLP